MGWERLFAACHKHTKTWHRRRRSQKWSRGYTRIHSTTLTFGSVWGLERTRRHTPPQNRRSRYYTIEWWHNSKYESTMAYKNVRIEKMVRVKWPLTWTTGCMHVLKRWEIIVHWPDTRHRPKVKGRIRSWHIPPPVGSHYDINVNATARAEGKGITQSKQWPSQENLQMGGRLKRPQLCHVGIIVDGIYRSARVHK
jgi:hypothetical protein